VGCCFAGCKRKLAFEFDDEKKRMNTNLKNVGGTSGGLGEFLLGLALFTGGAYWLTQQVSVSSGAWNIYGYNSFGLSLIPFLLGVMMLFINGKSIAGHALVFIGVVIIFTGIIMNLRIYFQPTSLFNTLLMLGLLFAGLGLLIKSLRPHLKDADRANDSNSA
jgi:uncharacterized protein